MTPLEINLADSAIADATDKTRKLLNMLGQENERGYRRALAPLLRYARWFGPTPNKAEQAVQTLNFVSFAVDFDGRLSDGKSADLCLFFIERIRNMKGEHSL